MRAAGLALVLIAPVQAQTVSPAPERVSVTIYRDPARGQGAMDRNWPRGYALISETRTVRVPAGDSVVRFEGVAQGLLPETAIVTGLPSGVREKNRDARLLSPAGLVDAYLKRRVHLVRTSRATGKRTEQDAIIQAGPDGGVIVTTADGVEALGCAGLPERMTYDGVPPGLSAKPTLSVLTTADRAMTATVTLTYLAQGFDWSANYVATTNAGGKTLRLFAWLTVANGGSQSFTDATLQVVAGTANRRAGPSSAPVDTGPGLSLRCWPADITSTHPEITYERLPWHIGQEGRTRFDAEDIVLTAARVAPPPVMMTMAAPAPVVARQEALGDLKLYRVPMRTTVAAQSQKQVAMIDQPLAAYDIVYSSYDVAMGDGPMTISLRMKNRKEAGLGLPLPGGTLAVFEPGQRALFAGSGTIADRAVGEETEVTVGASSDVRFTRRRVSETDQSQGWQAVVTNALPRAVRAEIVVAGDPAEPVPGLTRGPGGWRIPVVVPANGTATVRYRLKQD